METPRTPPPRLRVLFDGLCPLCQRSVAWLRRLDWRRRLEFLDARDPAARPARVPLDPQRLLEEMHAIDRQGRVTRGFAAFRRIARELPALWPVWPFLHLPGVPALGQRLYLWVARNRFHLVPCHDGQCQVPLRRPPAAAGASGGQASPLSPQ